jgi:hypothetical protein
VEEKRPIGLLPLGHEEERGQELDRQKHDQEQAADAVENPNEHGLLSLAF